MGHSNVGPPKLEIWYRYIDGMTPFITWKAVYISKNDIPRTITLINIFLSRFFLSISSKDDDSSNEGDIAASKTGFSVVMASDSFSGSSVDFSSSLSSGESSISSLSTWSFESLESFLVISEFSSSLTSLFSSSLLASCVINLAVSVSTEIFFSFRKNVSDSMLVTKSHGGIGVLVTVTICVSHG